MARAIQHVFITLFFCSNLKCNDTMNQQRVLYREMFIATN